MTESFSLLQVEGRKQKPSILLLGFLQVERNAWVGVPFQTALEVSNAIQNLILRCFEFT